MQRSAQFASLLEQLHCMAPFSEAERIALELTSKLPRPPCPELPEVVIEMVVGHLKLAQLIRVAFCLDKTFKVAALHTS